MNATLPELPETRAIRAGDGFPKAYALAYTADQMKEYAQAAITADRSAREGEAVAEVRKPLHKTEIYIGPLLPFEEFKKLPVGTKLYTAPADRGVAEGYVMVPIEPTDEMLFLAELSSPRGYRDLYRAMLSAAPQPTPKADAP
jgi:hypothetical protein